MDQIALHISDLITRIRRSKDHVAKSNFQEPFHPGHQKAKHKPINLQKILNTEVKKLRDKKHKTELTNFPDKYSISPIVVIVKK